VFRALRFQGLGFRVKGLGLIVAGGLRMQSRPSVLLGCVHGHGSGFKAEGIG
jgi:hypothetical protein